MTVRFLMMRANVFHKTDLNEAPQGEPHVSVHPPQHVRLAEKMTLLHYFHFKLIHLFRSRIGLSCEVHFILITCQAEGHSLTKIKEEISNH